MLKSNSNQTGAKTIIKPCPLCAQARDVQTIVAFETDLLFNFCPTCSLYFLNPRKALTYDEYPQDYEPYWPPLREEANGWRRWERKRHVLLRRRLVEKVHPFGGSCLDVGCATGHFLQELASTRRWKVVGIDINPQVLEIARRQGLNVLLAEVTDLPFKEPFDVITLWEVIEHLPDPRAALKASYDRLVPGGTLVVSTPNGCSWQKRWWGRHWIGWSPPYHLQVFSQTSLETLLREAGFSAITRRSLPQEKFYFQTSLKAWTKRRIESDIPQKLASLIGDMFSLSVWPILRGIDLLPGASGLVLEASK